MLIFNRHADISKHLQLVMDAETNIGFVPTMGALHDGHLSLLKTSVENNAITVISIFVNPTQFTNLDDLAKYPRTIESDIEKIKSVNSDIIVFTPSVDDIYEGNTVSQHFDFEGLENQMEGKFRPGHFDGVGTIVKRLFEIIQPTNAYFGEKDFQQLQIVKKMTQKLHLPVNVVGCPIHREPNGLARSSRNERLSDAERAAAAIIYKTLTEVRRKFDDHTIAELQQFVADQFSARTDIELEYFEIADETTLVPSQIKLKNVSYRAFIAVIINKIRLIDTISLN